MSTAALAGTETAQGQPPLETVGNAIDRQVRAGALKELAAQVLGLPPEKPDGEAVEAEGGGQPSEDGDLTPEAEAGNADALSQDDASEATAEAGAEDATDTETEKETEAEDLLGDELRGKLDEKTQSAINKRIGKEVAKTKAEKEARAELEAKLADLEAKVTELSNKPTEPPAAVPTVNAPLLAHVNDAKQLQAEAAKAETALEQSEDLLNTLDDAPEKVESALKAAGIKLADDSGAEDYSVSRMRQTLRAIHKSADKTLRRAIPERVEFLKQADSNAEEVVKLLPELKDRTSPRYAKFQQVLQMRPELRNHANWPIEAAARVLGWEQLEALQEQAKPKTEKVKAKLDKPPTIPKPQAAATVPRAPRGLSETVVERALSGDKNARHEYIKSILPKIPGM